MSRSGIVTASAGWWERRGAGVALLAARHSSRIVAQQLGLSVATVNNTLARVYAKLGISRRAQLAALVEATPRR
ncbi:hypothetical protein EJK15_12620 [Nonomuraea basaltis]|nr:hypothetical protein EJK15_12620 [Nonomuraea basaltis]